MTGVYAEGVVGYAQAGWPCIIPVPALDKFPPVPTGDPIALYRHVDARGELLYVGITSDPTRRWTEHLETSLWSRFAAATYVQWFHVRRAALAAERSAIKHEYPIFNTARPGRRNRAVTDRQLAYLRTGRSGLWRRVPCCAVAGEFCLTCGPDADLYLDSLGVSA